MSAIALSILFTSEERQKISKEAKDYEKAKVPGAPLEVTDRLRCVLPQEAPNWNLNTDNGIKSLNDHRVALLKGLPCFLGAGTLVKVYQADSLQSKKG